MVLHNAHCKMRMWRANGAMDHLVRNGDGDELLFIHNGAGQLFCDFGRLDVRMGDYVMLPRGTMCRHSSSITKFWYMRSVRSSPIGFPEQISMPS